MPIIHPHIPNDSIITDITITAKIAKNKHFASLQTNLHILFCLPPKSSQATPLSAVAHKIKSANKKTKIKSAMAIIIGITAKTLDIMPKKAPTPVIIPIKTLKTNRQRQLQQLLEPHFVDIKIPPLK